MHDVSDLKQAFGKGSENLGENAFSQKLVFPQLPPNRDNHQPNFIRLHSHSKSDSKLAPHSFLVAFGLGRKTCNPKDPALLSTSVPRFKVEGSGRNRMREWPQSHGPVRIRDEPLPLSCSSSFAKRQMKTIPGSCDEAQNGRDTPL